MRFPISITAASIGLVAGLWLLQPEDPNRRNHFDQEATPLRMGLLPVSQGLTFALDPIDAIDDTKKPHVILVTGFEQDLITGLDLTAEGLTSETDIFEVIDEVGYETLGNLANAITDGSEPFPIAVRELRDLAPVAGSSSRHIASGTNFHEHQVETNAQSVFNFPKFGQATPPMTSVATMPNELLDYEVEICTRFDRDITSMQDFDLAQKGFFLCGDFSDRAVLTRLIDPDNFDSGQGFSDAKSGPGRFPSGGLFVVPQDWRRFVENERLVTQVNGTMRQDTRAGGMILSFRDLVEKVLADTVSTRFIYQQLRWHLVENGKVARGQVLMSGTPEGVIFIPPTTRQIIRGALRYVTSGDFLLGHSAYGSVIEAFIKEEQQSGRYLKPGDHVSHLSSTMGWISVEVRPAQDNNAHNSHVSNAQLTGLPAE